MNRLLLILAAGATVFGVAQAQPNPAGPPKAGEPWVYPGDWKPNHPKFGGPAVQPVHIPAPALNTNHYPSIDMEPNEGTIGVHSNPTSGVVTPTPPADGLNIQTNGLVTSFPGIAATSLTPPDNCVSVGGDYIVETINSTIRILNKANEVLYEGTAQSFFGLSGAFLFDPKVSYDPWRGRWVMLWHRYDAPTAQLILAVSADGNPYTNGWWYYAFPGDIGGSTHTWADYWDLGYSASTVHFSGEWYVQNGGYYSAGFYTLNPTQIYNAQSANYIIDTGTWFAPRSAKMMNTFHGGPVFVASSAGGGSSVQIYRIDDPLGTHSIGSWNLGVNAYSAPGSPRQPGGGITGTIDSRMMPAVLNFSQNKWRLYCGLICDNPNNTLDSACRLYIFDPENITKELDWNYWHSNESAYYASPAVNYDGTCNWVYTHSGPSVYPTAAYTSFETTGFTNSYQNLATGGNNYFGGRWGDYFAGDCDWGDYYNGAGHQKMWFYGEYANSAGNYATYVGATISAGQTAGTMTVSPGTGITLAGYAGTFGTSNFAYTVGNSGNVGYRYKVTSTPSYFDAAVGSGEIYENGSIGETISNNAGINSLGYGKHFGNVVFTNQYNGATIVRSTEVDVYAIVPVTGFAVKLGKQTAGNLASLQSADGNALRVCRFIVPNATTPPVQVEVTATLPGSSASQMVFRTRVKLVNSGVFKQQMQWFNWVTNNWDVTDTRDDSLTLSYQTFDLWTSGSAARYIGSGNALKGKYSVRQTGPASTLQWCVDTDHTSFYAFP